MEDDFNSPGDKIVFSDAAEHMVERVRHTKLDQEHKTFKEDQRAMLENKARIQRRIEALKRQYEFVEKLSPQDVDYVLKKQQEQAALLLQRGWRRHKA